MNVPHENSPVVDTPNTRSGTGSSVLIASRCAANSFSRNSFTSSRRVAVETIVAGGTTEVWLTALPLIVVLAVHSAIRTASDRDMWEVKPMFVDAFVRAALRGCPLTRALVNAEERDGRPRRAALQIVLTRNSISDRTEYFALDLLCQSCQSLPS